MESISQVIGTSNKHTTKRSNEKERRQKKKKKEKHNETETAMEQQPVPVEQDHSKEDETLTQTPKKQKTKKSSSTLLNIPVLATSPTSKAEESLSKLEIGSSKSNNEPKTSIHFGKRIARGFSSDPVEGITGYLSNQRRPSAKLLEMYSLLANGKKGSEQMETEKKTKFTIYISNIPFRANEEQLRTSFEKFGIITGVRLPSLVDQQGIELKRGYGYIDFEEEESAKNALQMNGQSLDGRVLKVEISKPKGKSSLGTSSQSSKQSTQLMQIQETHISNQKERPQPKLSEPISDTSQVLRVRNFSQSCSEDVLREMLKPYGTIKMITILPNRKSGLAFVEFVDELSAQRALELNGKIQDGKAIHVSMSEKQTQEQKNQMEIEKQKENPAEWRGTRIKFADE